MGGLTQIFSHSAAKIYPLENILLISNRYNVTRWRRPRAGHNSRRESADHKNEYKLHALYPARSLLYRTAQHNTRVGWEDPAIRSLSRLVPNMQKVQGLCDPALQTRVARARLAAAVARQISVVLLKSIRLQTHPRRTSCFVYNQGTGKKQKREHAQQTVKHDMAALRSVNKSLREYV